jgi:uncharacterized membrane protein YfhO
MRKNWKAVVNGKPTAMIRANGAFRAVPVQAGHQRVELFYWPISTKIGLCVSAAFLLTWAWSGLRFFLARRSQDNRMY